MKNYRHIQIGMFVVFFLALGAIAASYVYADNIDKIQADGHYQKGLILYHQGKYDEAKIEFSKAKALIAQTEQDEESSEPKANIKKVKKKSAKKVAKKPEPKLIPPPQDTKPVQIPVEISSVQVKYVIGSGDELSLSVWQNEDLNIETLVRPDGKISFPLLGELRAAGFTVEQFRKNLTLSLMEYIRNPQVTVSIKKMGAEKVVVLGQVKNPGVYEVSGRKTILEAIGQAGGFTRDAVLKSVVLVKGGVEKPVPRTLNLTRALVEGESIENVTLSSEDIVYVPGKVISDVSYFFKTILDPVSRGLFTSKEIRDW